jgi:CO dehydrogenase/acetyl-CoA synthase delta subunit
MIVEVKIEEEVSKIDLEAGINDIFDKIEAKNNKRLTDDEMRDIANAYINAYKPYIVKVIN